MKHLIQQLNRITQHWKNFLFLGLLLLILSSSFALIKNILEPDDTNAALGINQQITYQAKIANSSGVSVTSGNYNFNFILLNAATGGTKLWEESWTSTTTAGVVSIVNGVFSVALGTSTSLSTVDFNSTELFLQVNFDADSNGSFEETFTPRKRITSSPYAFNADTVDGLHATTTATAGQLLALDSSVGMTLNSATTTGSLYAGAYASTTLGFFTKGDLHVGGASTFDGTLSGTGWTSSQQSFWNTTTTWAGFLGEFNTYLNATTTLDLTTFNATTVTGTNLTVTNATTSTRLVVGSTNPTNNFGKLWVGGDIYSTGSATTTGTLYVNEFASTTALYVGIDSQTSTSTQIRGGMIVDATTLVVNANENRVGIGTVSTLNSGDLLTVAGGVSFYSASTTDTLYVGGYASSTGGLFTQGALHVGGASTFDGTLSGTGWTSSQQSFWNTTTTWAGFLGEFNSYLNATTTLDLTTFGATTISATNLTVTNATTSTRLVVGSTNPTNNFGALWVGGDIYSTGSATTTGTLYVNEFASTTALYVGIDSQTSTSTQIRGGMIVDATTLVVNANENRVGIGTVSTLNSGDLLTVAGGTSFYSASTTDSLYAGGYASSTLGLFTKGDLHVGGASTFDGTLSGTGWTTSNQNFWNTTTTWAGFLGQWNTYTNASTTIFTEADNTSFWNTTTTWAGFLGEFNSYLNATTTLDLTTFGATTISATNLTVTNATTSTRLVVGSTNPTNNFGKLWVGGDIYSSGSASTTGSLYVGGQVGIGTISPSGLFEVSTSTHDNMLVVSNTNGNVGIGTASPYDPMVAMMDSTQRFTLEDDDTQNGNSPKLSFFGKRGDSTFILGPSIQKVGSTAYGAGDLVFWQHPTGDYTTETEAMRITSAGKIGIGYSTPTSTLDIFGTFSVSSNATTTGRLVVGSTNPTNNFGKLWVGGDIYSSGSASTTGSLYVGEQVGIGTASPTENLTVEGSAGGNISMNRSTTPTSGGQDMGELVWYGLLSGASIGRTASIIGEADAAWSAGSAATKLSFFVTPSGSTTEVESMTLDSTGYLGIGDTSPASLFTVGSGDKFQINAEGNATTSGYLTIGTFPTGGSYANGSLNVQDKLVVGGNATTTGNLNVGNNEFIVDVTANTVSFAGYTLNEGSWNIDYNGLANINSGNDSNPGYRFSGNADTGMYQPYTDAIGFLAGGTRALTLTNTTASTSLDLYVGGNATTTLNLTVGSNSGTDDDYIFFDSANTEWIAWDNSPGEFDFSDNVNITGNATTSGYLTVGSAPTGIIYANGVLNVGGNATSTVMAGSVIVDTNVFVVNANENKVGINTASPVNTLTVDGSGVTLENNAPYYWNSYYSSSFKYWQTGFAAYINQDTSGDIVVKTAPSGTAGNAATFTTRLMVKNTGAVGIATSTPGGYFGEALTVVGGAYFGTNAAATDSVIDFSSVGVTKWYMGNDASNANTFSISTSTSGLGTKDVLLFNYNTGTTTIPGIYNYTAGTANVSIDANGLLTRITSSLRYKHDIDYNGVDGDLLYQLKSVSYVENSTGMEYIGFIAEDVAEVDPRLVLFDQQGRPDALRYDHFSALITKAVQDLKQQVDGLSLNNASTTELTVDNTEAPTPQLVVTDYENLSARRLVVSQSADFYGTITVIGEAGFKSKVTFEKEVVFRDGVYFNQDTAGVAKLIIGATSTEVIFQNEYLWQPIITITPKGKVKGSDYWVSDETVKGFRINLDPILTNDLEFNWQAVAVDGYEGQVAGDQAVAGCTDSSALNFNALATENDGSCVYASTESVVTPEEPAPIVGPVIEIPVETPVEIPVIETPVVETPIIEAPAIEPVVEPVAEPVVEPVVDPPVTE